MTIEARSQSSSIKTIGRQSLELGPSTIEVVQFPPYAQSKTTSHGFEVRAPNTPHELRIQVDQAFGFTYIRKESRPVRLILEGNLQQSTLKRLLPSNETNIWILTKGEDELKITPVMTMSEDYDSPIRYNPDTNELIFFIPESEKLLILPDAQEGEVTIGLKALAEDVPREVTISWDQKDQLSPDI